MRRIAFFIASYLFAFASCAVVDHPRDSSTCEFDSTAYVPYTDSHLDAHLSERLRQEFEWITPINLAFCLQELLSVMRGDTSFRQRWTQKVNNYYTVFNDSVSYFLNDGGICLFENSIAKNRYLFHDYDAENKFLLEHSFSLNPSVSRCDLLVLLGRYTRSDIREDLSSVFLDAIITDGESFVREVEADGKLTLAYRLWLDDIEKVEFVSSLESINHARSIIERKRKYILLRYVSSSSPLMQETLNVIRKTTIRGSD